MGCTACLETLAMKKFSKRQIIKKLPRCKKCLAAGLVPDLYGKKVDDKQMEAKKKAAELTFSMQLDSGATNENAEHMTLEAAKRFLISEDYTKPVEDKDVEVEADAE